MLQLKNITKTYQAGKTDVHALKGISVDFRPNEFVSVLGPSGCGKTTLLNIVGGLDRYTSGDLIINGTSTKQYKDADWDAYRNHSIGFIFQSYNLIPHQSVLANVELALTLSGISKSERRRRAREALEKVGLGDKLRQKPNQLSGGQMQRVAIARAIINNPDILLADEPTGALDTVSSVQIMDLLKEIARDKLVIMVTHNPDLAEQYSTRIIRLLDGEIVSDSCPVSPEEVAAAEAADKAAGNVRQKHTSMSFFTAFSLSLNNLLTKKGRTVMVAFAGSIGIIGIALILSLSTGINDYIDTVQKDTLSSYPLEINRQTMDMGGMMAELMDNNKKAQAMERDPDRIYANNIMNNMLHAMNTGVTENNLKDFKTFIESRGDVFEDTSLVSAVKYEYPLTIDIFSTDTENGILQVNPSQVMSQMMGAVGLSSGSTTTSAISDLYGLNVWSELLDNRELLDSQYEFLNPETMHWPEKYDEIIIVVSKNNELSDISLYALGLKDTAELAEMFKVMKEGGDYQTPVTSYSIDDIMALTFGVVLPADRYVYDPEAGHYVDTSSDTDTMARLIADGTQLRVVGIVREREGAVSTSISGTVGYTHALTEFVAISTDGSDIVKAQKNDTGHNVIDGLEFNNGQYDDMDNGRKAGLFTDYAATRMPDSEKAAAVISLLGAMTPEQKESFFSTLSEAERETLVGDDVSGMDNAKLKSFIRLHLTDYDRVYRQFLLDMFQMTLSQMGEQERGMMESYLANMSEDDIIDLIQKQLLDPQSEDAQEAMLMDTMSYLTDDQLRSYARSISEAMTIEKLEKMEGSLSQMALLFDRALADMTEDEQADMFDRYMPKLVSDSSYDAVMSSLGVVDLDNPSSIKIYAASFDAKDTVSDLIADYNARAEEEGREEDKIQYTDMVGILMSFFTDLINAVSYVLIAFVSISLVVSSIMIGIITYISVLERTREIGVLRAMGASKRDISRVFNAEAFIIGVTAGLLGVLVTVLLNIPISLIIRAKTDIPILTASLPLLGGVALVLISALLTSIAGLIPSRSAAKKDPVVALRTE